MNCKFPFCEKPVENKELRLCATHAFGFRKSQREEIKNEGKKRKSIAKVSEKKADKLKPYAVLRRNYLKENPVCELFLPGCEGESSEIHHCSMSELDFLEVSTWKAACSSCHRYCETQLSAEERRRLGLLIDQVNKKFIEPHKI